MSHNVTITYNKHCTKAKLAKYIIWAGDFSRVEPHFGPEIQIINPQRCPSNKIKVKLIKKLLVEPQFVHITYKYY